MGHGRRWMSALGISAALTHVKGRGHPYRQKRGGLYPPEPLLSVQSPPYLCPGCWELLLASCNPSSLRRFSRSPSCPPAAGCSTPSTHTHVRPPTPPHRTHIWTHFQVDLLLVVVPQLLGGFGLFGDVGFLGVLDEVRVIFPLPGREAGKGGALRRLTLEGERPTPSPRRGEATLQPEPPPESVR